jgi:hypothetical protein
MNRAQQAYYLENNEFAANSDFGKLGLGVATQTTNYKYQINAGGANSSAVTNQAKTVVDAAPLKSYIGGVSIATQAATSEATTIAVLCEATQARVNGGSDVVASDFTANGPSCPTSFAALK